jgi:TRAP-type mannitol/chloroaromatic compound transport system permease small subunit
MRTTGKKESRVFDILVLLFFGLFIAGITSVLFYVYPVSVLTCAYVEPNQVDCRLQERAIGLIPIQEIAIVDLKRAYVIKEVTEVRRDGRKEKLVADRVLLQTSSDKIPLNSFDESGGFLARNTAEKIREFLHSHSEETLRVWQATWVPLGISLFFFPIALLMLYAALDILFCGKKRQG